MISFKQYISEQATSFIEFQNASCSDFLSKINKDGLDAALVLYRGTGNNTKIHGASIRKMTFHEDEIEVNIKKVRKDREPLDTPVQISEILDDLFFDKFGWRPRSQGLFCATKENQASQYGNVFGIMPMGNISYLWSPKVTDLALSIKQEMLNLDIEWINYSSGEYTVEELDEIKLILEKFVNTYRDDGILEATSAVKSREIMIRCDEYAAVDEYSAHLLKKKYETNI